jgi:hypothetical protein
MPDGRRMRLLSAFAYIDPAGLRWDAPSGWVIDGASIPPVVWPFAGTPYVGVYRDASVIHDVACDQKLRPWEQVHEVFYHAMISSGVETWRAKIMYAAVYHLGPRWARKVVISRLPVTQEPVAKKKALEYAEAGSNAVIIKKDKIPQTSTERLLNKPVLANFTVQIDPPTTKMSDETFNRLKAAIQEKEPTAAGGFSLEEIRGYK